MRLLLAIVLAALALPSRAQVFPQAINDPSMQQNLDFLYNQIQTQKSAGSSISQELTTPSTYVAFAIPVSSNNYQFCWTSSGSANGQTFSIKFNGDSSSSYYYTYVEMGPQTVISAGPTVNIILNNANSSAGDPAYGCFYFSETYQSAGTIRGFYTFSLKTTSSSSFLDERMDGTAKYKGANHLASIELDNGGGSFVGKFRLTGSSW